MSGSKYLVDPKSMEIAEHFLSGLEGDEPTDDNKWELAHAIQQAVEDWFEHGKPAQPPHVMEVMKDDLMTYGTAFAKRNPDGTFTRVDPKDVYIKPETITVCSACLQASCWQGLFYCDEYKTAGTVEKTIEELKAMALEHPSYWVGER